MQPAVTKGFASDANHRAPSSPVPMYLRRADAASVQAQAWAHRPAQPACPRAAVPRAGAGGRARARAGAVGAGRARCGGEGSGRRTWS